MQNESGETHTLVLELLSSVADVDPVDLLKLPSTVEHTLAKGVLNTTLRSLDVTLDASLELPPEALGLPTLNWVETGDQVCRLNGICDKVFYGGGTLEGAVLVVDSPETRVSAMTTPWDAFIDSAPRSILVREAFQQYASNPWFNSTH